MSQYVLMDIQLGSKSTRQYGYGLCTVNLMFLRLTQVKIWASIHRVSFLNQKTLFRMANSFFITLSTPPFLYFNFCSGNSKPLTLESINRTFPLRIYRLWLRHSKERQIVASIFTWVKGGKMNLICPCPYWLDVHAMHTTYVHIHYNI